MDEMPLTFDMQPNHTINNTGEKAAKIRMTRNEKNCTTVVLVFAGEGLKFRPMVIFKRKTVPKVANKHGVMMQIIDGRCHSLILPLIQFGIFVCSVVW